MKKILTQFGKNEKGTGLKNILSYIYKNKPSKVELIFNTNSGIKSLAVGWKSIRENGKLVRGYSYIIPKDVSKTNKEIEIFETSQDDLLPNLTTTLIKMGFKDKNIEVKTNKETDVAEIFKDKKLNIEDEFEDEIKPKKKDYKLGTIELLHKLFNKNNGNKVYWPNDLKYKKATSVNKKEILNEKIKEVHRYKKLMGDVMVDYPLQELSGFNISSSSFNINAKGVIPVVLELKDGRKVEAKIDRDKTLVKEGLVRVPYLLANLTKELFLELKKVGAIDSNEIYVPNKTYKVNLQGNGKIEIPLTNPIIRKIPQDEIVDLVWDIERLKIKQKVYNRKIKKLKEKTRVFTEFIQNDVAKLYEEIGIKSDGTYNPRYEEEDNKKEIQDVKINRKVDISIVKFPATAIEKEETQLLDELTKKAEKPDTPMETILKMIEKLEKEIKKIKKTLKEKRFKLNLIKNTLFLKGFDETLNYEKDENGNFIFIENSRSKKSVDGKKEYVLFKNSDGTRTVRVLTANEFV